MTVHWAITYEEQGRAIRWEWDELVVSAVRDGGDWAVQYGRNRSDRLFSTTTSYADAVADAETCMRLLAMEYADVAVE